MNLAIADEDKVLKSVATIVSYWDHFESHNLKELSHDPELVLVRAREDDWLEIGVDGFEEDRGVAPGVTVGGLLALVALDGVALTSFWIGRGAQLDPHHFALPGALNGRDKEAVGALWNHWLHGLAHQLGDKHPWADAMELVDGNPLPAAILNLLGSTEGPGSDPERDKRDTSDVLVLGRRLDHSYPRRSAVSIFDFGLVVRIGIKSAVGLRGHPGCNNLLEIRVVHKTNENFFVLVHALHEERLQ